MANIGFLLPDKEVMDCALAVVGDGHPTVKLIKTVNSRTVIEEAKKAVNDGMQILVARGFQSLLLQRNTGVSVVDISLTVQEIGLLIIEAKEILKKDDPFIAFIGFSNMFGNMEHLEKLFHFRMKIYFLYDVSEVQIVVKKAYADGAELIIGGKETVRYAEYLGIPNIYLESGEDSIKNALNIAEKIGEALDLKKSSNEQIKKIFDTSYNGIIKINSEKEVETVNNIIEEIVGENEEKLIGQPVDCIITGLDIDEVNKVLSGKEEAYSDSLWLSNRLFMILCMPIWTGESITGAFINFHWIKLEKKPEKERLKNIYQKGYVPRKTFADIRRSSEKIKKTVKLSKYYAASKEPILIVGAVGTEKSEIAESIHMVSPVKNGPFINVDCRSFHPSEQRMIFYGGESKKEYREGILEQARGGTLFLENLDALCWECQSIICQSIMQGYIFSGTEMSQRKIEVRFIFSLERDFAELKNPIIPELVYMIRAFKICLPSLNDNKRDIRMLAEYYVKQSSMRYSRYTKLTEEAYKVLENFIWEGNVLQLKYFCEHMVLSGTGTRIGEQEVRDMLSETYPVNKTEQIIEEENQILSLLRKYKGNRKKVAEHLGVSTTTLWRKMKKLNISSQYG